MRSGVRSEGHPSHDRSRAARLPAAFLPVPFLAPLGASFATFGLRAVGFDLAAAAQRFGVADPGVLRLAAYAPCAVVAAVALAVLLRRRGFSAADLGWRTRPSTSESLTALLAAVAAAVLWLPVDALRRAAGLPAYWDPHRTGFVVPHTPVEFALAALAGVVLVPPAEEVLFRGYTLQVLVGRLGCASGLLLHSLLFALYHVAVGPGVMLYVFFWSFLPALLYLRYRSLAAPVVMHAANNAFADLLVPVLFVR